MRIYKQGFTLIELSIVLVIIGLIIGGVMVGQDLIRGSKIRSQISFLSEYATAITTFRLKYNCLPGDCNQAESFGLGTSGDAGKNGDGNGEIFSAAWMRNFAAEMAESLNVPYHLAQANLLDGTYHGSHAAWTNASWNLQGYQPNTEFRTGSFVTAFTVRMTTNNSGTGFGGNILFLHGNYIINTTTLEHEESTTRAYNYGLTALEGFELDSKMDDGKPKTGRMIEAYRHVGPEFSGSGRCHLSGANRYDIHGLKDGTVSNLTETPARPDKLDCSVGISGLW